MVKLLRLSVCLCLALAAFAWLAQALAQRQDVPHGITQLHLLDCARPCWIGITPGLTSIGDAKAKLITTYIAKSELTIMDSGFADGPVYSNTVENTIEGADFSLSVRLETSALVDGKSETIQSIGLFETRKDKANYAPTVRDVLGTFGAPQGAMIDQAINGTYTVTLVYAGMEVAFNTYDSAIKFTENPTIYLERQTLPLINYRPWKGLGTLTLGNK